MYRMKLTPFSTLYFLGSFRGCARKGVTVSTGGILQYPSRGRAASTEFPLHWWRMVSQQRQNTWAAKHVIFQSEVLMQHGCTIAAWMYLGVGSLLKEPEHRKYAAKICKTQHSPHIWINYFTNLHQGATGIYCSIHQEGTHQNLQQVLNLWSLIESYPWLRNLAGSCFACSQLRLLGSDGDPHQVGCPDVQTAILSEICLVLVSMFL